MEAGEVLLIGGRDNVGANTQVDDNSIIVTTVEC